MIKNYLQTNQKWKLRAKISTITLFLSLRSVHYTFFLSHFPSVVWFLSWSALQAKAGVTLIKLLQV